MVRPEDQAPEREHRPIGRDDAKLRQQVDAEDMLAGGIERNFGEPGSERRPQKAAKPKFMAYGNHERHVAGWRAIEKRRYKYPQRRLRQRCTPNRKRRTRAQELDEYGYVKH
jgi:hypothetical protein